MNSINPTSFNANECLNELLDNKRGVDDIVHLSTQALNLLKNEAVQGASEKRLRIKHTTRAKQCSTLVERIDFFIKNRTTTNATRLATISDTLVACKDLNEFKQHISIIVSSQAFRNYFDKHDKNSHITDEQFEAIKSDTVNKAALPTKEELSAYNNSKLPTKPLMRLPINDEKLKGFLSSLSSRLDRLDPEEEKLIQHMASSDYLFPLTKDAQNITGALQKLPGLKDFIPLPSFQKYLKEKTGSEGPFDSGNIKQALTPKDSKTPPLSEKILISGFLQSIVRNASVNRISDDVILELATLAILHGPLPLSQALAQKLSTQAVPPPTEEANDLYKDIPEKAYAKNKPLAPIEQHSFEIVETREDTPVKDPSQICYSYSELPIGTRESSLTLHVCSARRKGVELPIPPKACGEDALAIGLAHIHLGRENITVPLTAVFDGGGGHALAHYGQKEITGCFEKELQALVNSARCLTPNLVAIALINAERSLFENQVDENGQMIRGSAYDYLKDNHVKLRSRLSEMGIISANELESWNTFKGLIQKSLIYNAGLTPEQIHKLSKGEHYETFRVSGSQLTLRERKDLETSIDNLEASKNLSLIQITGKYFEQQGGLGEKQLLSPEFIKKQIRLGASVLISSEEDSLGLKDTNINDTSDETILELIKSPKTSFAFSYAPRSFNSKEDILQYFDALQEMTTPSVDIASIDLDLSPQGPEEHKAYMAQYLEKLKKEGQFKIKIGDRTLDLTNESDAKDAQELYSLFRGDPGVSRSGITVQSNICAYLLHEGKPFSVNFNRGDSFASFSGDQASELPWSPISLVGNENRRDISIVEMGAGIITQSCDGHREKISLNDMQNWESERSHMPIQEYVMETIIASCELGGGDDISIIGSRVVPNR